MIRRVIETWTDTEISILVEHPAIRLRLTSWSANLATLAGIAGVYALLSATTQSSYVGSTRELAERPRISIRESLPSATHILIIEPLGLPWTEEQRLALEAALIAVLRGLVNKSPGHPGPLSTYLNGVVAEVVTLAGLILPLAAGVGLRVPTQGGIARQLVLGEGRHPYTVSQLIDRLRALGWSASGSTVHRTLRRDLLDRGRGGSDTIRVTGPWSVGSTMVFVAGRRYASGWQPPTPRGEGEHGAGERG